MNSLITDENDAIVTLKGRVRKVKNSRMFSLAHSSAEYYIFHSGDLFIDVNNIVTITGKILYVEDDYTYGCIHVEAHKIVIDT